jgi:hypothetical protein
MADQVNHSAAPWELADAKLVAQCRFEAFVGSGPGGQKRAKTNAAVRYTHLPTGIWAIAADSRSQRENRIHALRNLRHKLAIGMPRDAIDPLSFAPPSWLAQYPHLHMSPKNPRYPALVALVLDALKAMRWSVPHAAVMLGVSRSALWRFLRDDSALWAHVHRVWTELGIKAP